MDKLRERDQSYSKKRDAANHYYYRMMDKGKVAVYS